jgi:hypothetical protein
MIDVMIVLCFVFFVKSGRVCVIVAVGPHPEYNPEEVVLVCVECGFKSKAYLQYIYIYVYG